MRGDGGRSQMRLGAFSPNPARQAALGHMVVGWLGKEWQPPSAAPGVTKQPYLGSTLLAPVGDGPRKGGSKIAHSAPTLSRKLHLGRRLIPAVEIQTRKKNLF